MTDTHELFRVLMQQHREIDKLLDRLATCDEGARERLFAALAAKLVSHARAEESTLYAALVAAEIADDPHVSDDAIADHAAIDEALLELDQCQRRASAFTRKLSRLTDVVQRHVQREENELFARARAQLNVEKLYRIQQQYEERQREELEQLGYDDDYETRTQHELVELAAERGVRGPEQLSHEELVSQLRHDVH